MSAAIQAKGLFAKVHLSSLPSDFSDILARQVADLSRDAERRVRQQISHHQMDHQGESWLSQGLGYVKDDRCPFCGQDAQANDLLPAYRSYFNTAYRNLKREVSQLSHRVDTAIGETSLSSARQAISGNAALAEFWKQFITLELPAISFPDIESTYAELREKCLTLAKKKQDNPIEPITRDADFSATLGAVEALGMGITAYNTAVDAANIRVNEQKAATRGESNIAALKNELSQLETRKERFDPEVAQACQAHKDAFSTKAILERKKEAAREQLDRHCQNLLPACEKSINGYLDQFNAGFRITNTRHLYTGGTPSSHYQLEINDTAIDVGDTRTPAGTPCFKTALSAGDRSALALAFFLAVVQQDANIGRTIVVLDDPFTSLDAFRRTCTQQLIQQLSDFAQQVIVLSHDALFLKLLSDECPCADLKALQMSKTADTTVIGEWDIEAAVQSSYMRDFSTLLAFYREERGRATRARSPGPYARFLRTC